VHLLVSELYILQQNFISINLFCTIIVIPPVSQYKPSNYLHRLTHHQEDEFCIFYDLEVESLVSKINLLYTPITEVEILDKKISNLIENITGNIQTAKNSDITFP